MANSHQSLIRAVRIGEGDAGRVLGPSLKAIRQGVGLTQTRMAELLGVRQSAISKIEQRGDVQISTLQRYVEALGARLRIEGVFPDHSMSSLSDELGGRIDDQDQLVLPIFDNPPVARRDVILSIKPAYSEKILQGSKTVELRRRFPLSIARGTRAYIYSTSPVRALVGSAEIIDVERLPLSELWKLHGASASIEKNDFKAYFAGLREGYALKISHPRSLSRPLQLGELSERFGFKAPQSYLYPKPVLQRALLNEHSNLPD